MKFIFMKLNPTTIAFCFCTIILSNSLHSQNKNAIPEFTADTLKSGNYKDVFLSFFQLALQNLAGPNKELKFSANPYAIMMRADPDLAVDTSYIRYSALRKLNFGFGLRVDSSFKFNGFTSEVKYKIINRRDYTVYREFLQLLNNRADEVFKMNDGVQLRTGVLDSIGGAENEALSAKITTQWRALTKENKLTFDKLDESVRQNLIEIADNVKAPQFKSLLLDRQKVSMKQKLDSIYNDEKKLFENRLLWTASVRDTTYQDQFFFSNVVFETEILQGITRRGVQNQVEFNARALYNLVDDTLRGGRDLGRGILNFEGGINYVRRHKKTHISFFEFEAKASYKKIFTGAYIAERKEIFTLNGTFRFRIFEELWIPLEFKYDPKTGNVFGFLNLKLNFTAMKSALAKAATQH